MDVTGDFLAADCRKIVANDSADAIIADASSLKAGISLSREISRGQPTRRLGWKTDAPLTYRMADWENVGVHDFGVTVGHIQSLSIQTTHVQLKRKDGIVGSGGKQLDFVPLTIGNILRNGINVGGDFLNSGKVSLLGGGVIISCM